MRERFFQVSTGEHVTAEVGETRENFKDRDADALVFVLPDGHDGLADFL